MSNNRAYDLPPLAAPIRTSKKGKGIIIPMVAGLAIGAGIGAGIGYGASHYKLVPKEPVHRIIRTEAKAQHNSTYNLIRNERVLKKNSAPHVPFAQLSKPHTATAPAVPNETEQMPMNNGFHRNWPGPAHKEDGLYGTSSRTDNQASGQAYQPPQVAYPNVSKYENQQTYSDSENVQQVQQHLHQHQGTWVRTPAPITRIFHPLWGGVKEIAVGAAKATVGAARVVSGPVIGVPDVLWSAASAPFRSGWKYRKPKQKGNGSGKSCGTGCN